METVKNTALNQDIKGITGEKKKQNNKSNNVREEILPI
jgi:hypothetical protein